MSTARALSGETYSVRRRSLGATVPSAAVRSMAHRNAASVFPDPVGATTSVFSPRAIAAHAPDWAGVGSAKASANQARVRSENEASGEGVFEATAPPCYGPPATRRGRSLRPGDHRVHEALALQHGDAVLAFGLAAQAGER